MDLSGEFRWPESPPWPVQDWWLASGVRLGMSEDKIRFVATLARIGGDDPTRAKKNGEAARIAGLAGGKGRVFQVARSVSVKRLLDEAIRIKTGREPPITEEEIDKILVRQMRSPVATVAAAAIALHDKRADARRAANSESQDPVQTLRAIAEVSPEFAAELAAAQGIDPDQLELTAAQRAEFENRRTQVAWDWIARNPDRAAEFLRMAQQPRLNGSGHLASEDDHAVA